MITNEFISGLLDTYIPLGPAKMLLISDSGKNYMIDPRWLDVPRFISKASHQALLDETRSIVQEKGLCADDIISNHKDKINFLNGLVSGLLDRIKRQCMLYDSRFLLIKLVSMHEGLICRRERSKTITPAQIYCFGDNGDRDIELKEEE